jgi:hypothetical protein
MDDSFRVVIIIYLGFLLGLVVLSLLINLLLRVSRHFEDSDQKRSRLAH